MTASRYRFARRLSASARPVALLVAAAFLALVQIASAAHAASGEANAPDHNSETCALHIAGERSSAPPPAEAGLLRAPCFIAVRAFAAPAAVALNSAAAPLPPKTGPPAA